MRPVILRHHAMAFAARIRASLEVFFEEVRAAWEPRRAGGPGHRDEGRSRRPRTPGQVRDPRISPGGRLPM